MNAKNNGLPNDLVEMTLSGAYDTNELVVTDDVNFSRDMPPTPSTVLVSAYLYNDASSQSITMNTFEAHCGFFRNDAGSLLITVPVGQNIEEHEWSDYVEYDVYDQLYVETLQFYSNGRNTVELRIENENGDILLDRTRQLDNGFNSWDIQEGFDWNSSRFQSVYIFIERV